VQLAGRPLKQAVDTLVRSEFDPLRADLKRRTEQTTTQGGALIDRAGGYYQRLAQEAQGHVALQQAIGKRLEEAQRTAGDRTQQTLAEAGQETDRRFAADESLRGAGLEGGGEAAAAREVQAQRTRAAESSQAAQQSAAGGTANYEHLADLSDRATAARGGEVTQQLINRLASQQAGLRAEGADLETKASGRAIERLLGLRQSGFENQVTMSGLGIKQQDLEAQTADQERDARIAQDRIDASSSDRAADRQSREEIAAENRRSRERTAAAKGAKPKPESPDSKKVRSNIENAYQDMVSDPRLVKALRERRFDDVRNLVVNERGAEPLVYEAALERARLGGLKPGTITALRRAGVHVPKGWMTVSGPPRPN
jgi:hypothetical protein